MSKIMAILCAVAAVMLLTACSDNRAKQGEPKNTPFDYAGVFCYKEHDYIEFIDNWNGRYAVVHDPDCKKCLERYE